MASHPADAGSDHWLAHGHRLHIDEGTPLVMRREHEECAALEQAGHSGSIASTRELDAIGDPERGGTPFEFRPLVTVTGDHQIGGCWMSL